MGKVIRSKVNKEIEEKSWKVFLSQFKKDLSSEKLDKILSNYLSPEEKTTIARRLAIVFLFKQGKSYTEISKILGVGPQTISAAKKSVSKKFYIPYRPKRRKIVPLPGRSFLDDLSDALPRYKYLRR